MSKCNKCDTDMVLMSGTTYLEADSEPYESGVVESSKINEVEISVCAEYCEKCEKVESIYEQP